MSTRRVYRNNPHTIDALKDTIRTEIQNSSEEELLRVNANFMKDVRNACKQMDTILNSSCNTGDCSLHHRNK
jgi:hypothetical protein